MVGQQTPLNFGGQGQIAPKFLLLDHAPRQPRVFDRERKLIGAVLQDHPVAGPVRLRARLTGPSRITPSTSVLVRSGTAMRAPVRPSVCNSAR